MKIQHLHSPTAETSILGILLANSDLYIQTLGKITPEYFYNVNNQNIFRAMEHVYKQLKDFDLISICQRVTDMDCGMTDTQVTDVLGGHYSSASFDGYMETLQDKYRRRELYNIAENLTHTTTDPEQEVEGLVHESLEKITEVMSVAEDNSFDTTIADIDAKIEEFMDSDEEFLGMSTGIHKLDKMLEGIQGGQFIGFAAYTSQGKTWDALNIAYNLLQQGKKVCFITLENSKAQLLTRLASIHTGISDTKIKKGNTNAVERLQIKEYMQSVVDSCSTVYRSSEWNDIKTAIKKEALVGKPDLFILDYLQIVRGDKDPVRLLEDMSGYLQNTLIDIDIPMLALSQISNATANGATREDVLKFKGSGAIGASVSTAIFKKSLHNREEIEMRRQNGIPLESWWIVEKNRDGDYTGRVKTFFHPWSHKLWGEEEFYAEYGKEKYERQVMDMGFEDEAETINNMFNDADI